MTDEHNEPSTHERVMAVFDEINTWSKEQVTELTDRTNRLVKEAFEDDDDFTPERKAELIEACTYKGPTESATSAPKHMAREYLEFYKKKDNGIDLVEAALETLKAEHAKKQ